MSIESKEPIERLETRIQEAWKLGNLEVWRLGGLGASCIYRIPGAYRKTRDSTPGGLEAIGNLEVCRLEPGA